MMKNSASPYSNGVPAVPEKDASKSSQLTNIVRRKLTGYVGFANLPNQWHRKSVRKGFNFNVMVVGTLTLPPPSISVFTWVRRVWTGKINFS
jgi:hypothetical protein